MLSIFTPCPLPGGELVVVVPKHSPKGFTKCYLGFLVSVPLFLSFSIRKCGRKKKGRAGGHLQRVCGYEDLYKLCGAKSCKKRLFLCVPRSKTICLILSDVIRYYQMLSDVIRYYQMLSDIIRYYQILSDIIRCYQILSRCYQILSDVIRCYQNVKKIISCGGCNSSYPGRYAQKK